MENNLFDIINNRYSCRSFLDKTIEEETVQHLLELACKAPSAGGFQNYSIIKVDKASVSADLAKRCRGQKFIEKAPLNLVFCIDYRKLLVAQKYEPCSIMAMDAFDEFWMSLLDVGIVAQTVTLSAEAYGLKSVYIGNIINYMEDVSDLLKLPKGVIPAIMLTLGYPKYQGQQAEKYKPSAIVHDNVYSALEDEALYGHYLEQNKGWKLSAKDKWVQQLVETAKEKESEAYGKRVESYFKTHDIISPLQYWHGIYYNDSQGLSLESARAYLKKQGFTWLK